MQLLVKVLHSEVLVYRQEDPIKKVLPGRYQIPLFLPAHSLSLCVPVCRPLSSLSALHKDPFPIVAMTTISGYHDNKWS